MADTIKMLQAYMDESPAPMFLTSHFQAPADNYHNANKIEFHIQSSDGQVAVPLNNAGDGYRANHTGGFVGKEFNIPVFKESETFSALDMTKQSVGSNIYDDPIFQQNIVKRALWSARVLENKIRRAMELQASQILTLGTITSVDAANATVFTENFGALNTHFTTAGTVWSGSGHPVADLVILADLIAQDSYLPPDKVIMGSTSLTEALAITEFKDLFMDASESWRIGRIAPGTEDTLRGAQIVGTIWAGGHNLTIYQYNGTYKHPYTGVVTKFVPAEKVIMMSSQARFDATFGGIPNFGTDGRANLYFSGRIPNSGAVTDMHINAWINPDGETMTIGVGARPLLIPTAVNGFGCLTT